MTFFPHKFFCDSKMVMVVKRRGKGTIVHFKDKFKQIGTYQRVLLKCLQRTRITLGYQAEAIKLSSALHNVCEVGLI